jgi:hypothetical protein
VLLGQSVPHEVPLQVALPPLGEEQGVQELPHEAVLLFDRHKPLQLCEPDGQAPSQASF